MDWNGETAVTVFFKAKKSTGYLYVEANYFILAPLHKSFATCDTLFDKSTWQKVSDLLVKSLTSTPIVWVASPFNLLVGIFRPLYERMGRRRTSRMIKADPDFNFGASQSVREMATAHEFRTFFHVNMHLKIIQERVIDSVVLFLDNNNIDTTYLRGQQTHILNSGVIMSAGSVQAESLAIGESAQAVSLGPEDYGKRAKTSPPASTTTRMPPA